jgi:hypothetical protein
MVDPIRYAASETRGETESEHADSEHADSEHAESEHADSEHAEGSRADERTSAAALPVRSLSDSDPI